MACCSVCGRGVGDGGVLYRQNAVGEDGIFSCQDHNTQPIDPMVADIVETIALHNLVAEKEQR